jgi:hypothetical protein
VSTRSRAALLIGLAAILVAACGSDEPAASTVAPTANPATAAAPDTAAGGCADVIGVSIESGNDGFTVSATVASADTGWDKYADLWEVRAPDGTVLGERVLAHPHETEQPFTRSVGGVAIPPEVTEIVVAARDSVVGFCGAEFIAEVPHP